MPTENMLTRRIPAPSDPADPVAWLQGYSLSHPGIVEVASLTEANQVRASYIAGLSGQPRQALFVYRTDVDQLFRDTGTSWEFIAGRRHSATVNFARNMIENPSGPLVLEAQSVTFASPGFTLVSNNVVIPASGRYSLSADVNLTGAAGSVGRTFFQFSTTNGAVSTRIPATNENNYGGSVTMFLAAGWQLRIQGFHTGGGNRTWNATVEIDWLGPRWGA